MDSSQIFEGTKQGIVAFVATFIAIFVLAQFPPITHFSLFLDPVKLGTIKFFDAHNLLATFAVVGSNLYALVGMSPLVVVAILLPPLVLVLQGRDVVADASPDAAASTLATRGALVVVGYAPLAIAGAFFVFDGVSTADVVLTTAVYPLVFGALGGASTRL